MHINRFYEMRLFAVSKTIFEDVEAIYSQAQAGNQEAVFLYAEYRGTFPTIDFIQKHPLKKEHIEKLIRAIHYFALADKKGCNQSANMLGDLYYEGLPRQLEPNPGLAIKWYLSASQKNYAYSRPEHPLYSEYLNFSTPTPHAPQDEIEGIEKTLEESLESMKNITLQDQGLVMSETLFNDETSPVFQCPWKRFSYL